MSECLFCKIINKETSSEVVYEDQDIIGIKDINPKASVHILILPKKHIASIREMKPEDKDTVGKLFLAAKKMADEKNLPGYKLAINVGREGGQLIEHLHLHLLGGRIEQMP